MPLKASDLMRWAGGFLSPPPDNTGAIATVGAGPTGEFFWDSSITAGTYVQILNNSNHYSTLTVSLNVPGTGGGSFEVIGSNDGTPASYWTISGVSNRSGLLVQNY